MYARIETTIHFQKGKVHPMSLSFNRPLARHRVQKTLAAEEITERSISNGGRWEVLVPAYAGARLRRGAWVWPPCCCAVPIRI